MEKILAQADVENVLIDNQTAFQEKHIAVSKYPAADKKMLESIGNSPFSDLERLVKGISN